MATPRLFISYSHDSQEHKDWVYDLARRLRLEYGVDALLDAWDVQLGGDFARFMENVGKADKVLMVCTQQYVNKCNNADKGGVAYEKMIVTSRLIGDVYGDFIIPLLRSNSDGDLPSFMGSKRYIDFRNDLFFERNVHELAAFIHGVAGVKPPVGVNPFRQGLDASFGNAGRRLLPFKGFQPIRISCTDDRILTVGKNQNEIILIRLHPSGDVDTREGGRGEIRIPTALIGYEIADAVLVESNVVLTPRQDLPGAPFCPKTFDFNGHVRDFSNIPFDAIVVGSASAAFTCQRGKVEVFVAKGDGTPNLTFGNAGHVSLHTSQDFSLNWAHVKAVEESIFVFGMTRAGQRDEALLFRFMADGNLDLGFGEQGCVNLSKFVWFLNVSDVTQMIDGRIIVGGNGNEANLVRLLSNGQPDDTFGDSGVVEFRAQGRSTCRSVTFTDSSILFSGEASDGNSVHNVFLARLHFDGRPDDSFHEDGYLPIQIKSKDRFCDLCWSQTTVTILCASDADAMTHQRFGLARVHL
jgi:uncharacterized delta-60 repeat protein